MAKMFVREIWEGVNLYRDTKTGIAYIKNSRTGLGHTCHPNIDKTGSIRGMKKLGYWKKNDKVVTSHGYKYNISLFVIDKDDELDCIAADECMCEKCLERRNAKKRNMV